MSAGPQHPRQAGAHHEFNERDAIDAALIRLYRATREPRRLEGLLDRFGPLLGSVVNGYARPDEAYEDVMQFALLGFLRAVDTYERSSGVGFATFARSRVVGEIDARSSSAPRAARVRRARKALQRRALDARRARPTLTDDELAAALGVPLRELLDAQQVRPARCGPTDPAARLDVPDDGDGAYGNLGDVDPGDEVEIGLRILGPRDVETVPLRFVDHRSFAELHGRTDGVLPIEVLRVLNRALGRMREDLEAHLGSAHHDDPTLPAR